MSAFCEHWCSGPAEIFLLLVHWRCIPHCFPILSFATVNPETLLQLTSNKSISSLLIIPRVESSVWKCTPVAFLAPVGPFMLEFAHCQEQAITLVHNIITYSLTREVVYNVDYFMWRPSFELTLSITCISKE